MIGAVRMWAARMWARRYWTKTGGGVAIGLPVRAPARSLLFVASARPITFAALLP